MRTEFVAEKTIKKARLYITAKDVSEASINGRRIGNDILTPGYTPYNKRIETLTYDVTDNVATGRNAIGIVVAEGWYAGRFGPKRHWHKKFDLNPKVPYENPGARREWESLRDMYRKHREPHMLGEYRNSFAEAVRADLEVLERNYGP